MNTLTSKSPSILARALGVLAVCQVVTGICLGATAVPVVNFSFEIEGARVHVNTWYRLPTPSPGWVDGNAASNYEILRLNGEASHFPDYNTAPGGTRVLLLAGTSTGAVAMTQDLDFIVNAGDLVAVSYVLGASESETYDAGNVTAGILVDGVSDATETVSNDAADGEFKAFKSVFTATAGGSLSVGFNNNSDTNWLDLVDVTVVPAADAAAGQIPVGNFSFETEGPFPRACGTSFPISAAGTKPTSTLIRYRIYPEAMTTLPPGVLPTGITCSI